MENSIVTNFARLRVLQSQNDDEVTMEPMPEAKGSEASKDIDKLDEGDNEDDDVPMPR